MNNIQKAFAAGKAFIPFLTAGDPSLAVTERLVIAMAEEGADLIELGIPFSDPVAEGPVIQRADERALLAGTTLDGIFEMVSRVREQSAIPLAFMTYINPVFVYGAEKFFSRCADCGVGAVIVPDLPFEEREELLSFSRSHNVALIPLIAPTSKERIRAIAREAEGFVYCVSSMGVTGVRENIKTDLAGMVQLVKEEQDIPCAIGFGISTPEQAAEIGQYGDGVIVGSAIVKLIEQYGEGAEPHVRTYAAQMKAAVSAAKQPV
ncbi:tryptophan synthase subunit alpha [Oscillospiraceae bacterium MB08-C2-2]|nr:tryptophan synthase subunit alpha [Oscillospiraceae bacterium MB08-C2-2]